MNHATKIESLHADPKHSLPALDEHGFIIDPNAWSKQVAFYIAAQYEVDDLYDAHWQVIEFLRDRYLRLGAIPPMRRLCREFSHQKDTMKALFGSCRALWAISGLPHPGEEAFTYFD